MGILNNGFRDNYGCLRFAGAGVLSGAAPSALASAFHRPGAQRNMSCGEGISSALASHPSGCTHPVAWIMPRTAGAMSSRNNADVLLSSTSILLAGYPISGTTSITIDINNAEGQAVASGTGTANITITINNLTLTSSISGSGTATLELNGATSVLGATASVIGDATIVITGDLDLNAWGLMEGSTVDNSVLTNDSITQAVWSALAADNNLNNTMGELLNNAAAGGVDVGALADAIVDALKLDPSTLTVSKFLGLK